MSTVRYLHSINPKRRKQLQAFCADQASHFMHLCDHPDGAAAVLSVLITGDSQVVSKMAAIEPEHAMVCLRNWTGCASSSRPTWQGKHRSC